MMEFHHRLAWIIQLAADTKPTRAARKLGISEQMMRLYTAGKNSPSLSNLNGLKRLGISIDWLMSGRGEMLGTTPAAFRLRMTIARRVLEGKVGFDDIPDELWLWILDQWVMMKNDGTANSLPLIPKLERVLKQRYIAAVSTGDVDELALPGAAERVK